MSQSRTNGVALVGGNETGMKTRRKEWEREEREREKERKKRQQALFFFPSLLPSSPLGITTQGALKGGEGAGAGVQAELPRHFLAKAPAEIAGGGFGGQRAVRAVHVVGRSGGGGGGKAAGGGHKGGGEHGVVHGGTAGGARVVENVENASGQSSSLKESSLGRSRLITSS